MKLKMSLKNILLIFVIAFFSIIILWNLACAFGYVREGMEHKHTNDAEEDFLQSLKKCFRQFVLAYQ